MYELPVSLDDSCPIGSVAGAFASKGVVFENETQVIEKIRGKQYNPHDIPDEFKLIDLMIEKKRKRQKFYHEFDDFDIWVVPEELKK